MHSYGGINSNYKLGQNVRTRRKRKRVIIVNIHTNAHPIPKWGSFSTIEGNPRQINAFFSLKNIFFFTLLVIYHVILINILFLGI